MARRIITGIDIGSSSVRAIVAELGDDHPLPRIIGMARVESRGIRHGYVVDPIDASEAIAKAIARASEASGARVDDVFLSVGGTGVEGNISTGTIIVPRADTEIMPEDVERAHHMAEEALPSPANKRILHAIPVEYRIDGKRVLGRPVRMRGLKLEAKMLLVTVFDQHLDDLIEAVEKAGYIVADVMASPLAASLVALTKQQKMAGCVLVDIGAEVSGFVVHEDGLPVSLEIVPMGSTNITNDIALALKVSLEEAEKLKTGKISSPSQKKKQVEATEGRLAELFGAVERHLKSIGKQGLLPAGAVIVGGGAMEHAIEEHAKAVLGLPARVPAPEFMVDPETKLPIHDTTWFVAYGLTVFGASADGGGVKRGSSGWSSLRKTLSGIFRQLLP